MYSDPIINCDYFFNLILFGFDLTALQRVRRSKSASPWCFAVRVTILVRDTFSGNDLQGSFRFFPPGVLILFFCTDGCLRQDLPSYYGSGKKNSLLLYRGGAAVLPVLACYVFLIEPFWLETSLSANRQPQDPPGVSDCSASRLANGCISAITNGTFCAGSWRRNPILFYWPAITSSYL